MKKTSLLALVSVLLVAACGGEKAPWTATVAGSAADITIVPQDALAVASYTRERPDPEGTLIPARHFLGVTITDKPNICEELVYRNDTPNQSLLSFSLERNADQEITTGTYAISFWSDAITDPAAVRATAFLNKTNETCKGRTDNDEISAKSGSVTITKRTKSEVVGTYELTYGTGSIKGSFTAPICRGFIVPEVKSDFTCQP